LLELLELLESLEEEEEDELEDSASLNACATAFTISVVGCALREDCGAETEDVLIVEFGVCRVPTC